MPTLTNVFAAYWTEAPNGPNGRPKGQYGVNIAMPTGGGWGSSAFMSARPQDNFESELQIVWGGDVYSFYHVPTATSRPRASR